MMNGLFAAVAILLLFPLVNAWMLSQLGLMESYRVCHISMHYGRVFLSIRVQSNTFPTLIESRWHRGLTLTRSVVFPSFDAHNHYDDDDHGVDNRTRTRNCRLIQQSIWTQVDGLNRLWVMDIGWQDKNGQNCYPKLLAYDLLRNNVEVLRIDCSRYITPNQNDLLTIKLGPSLPLAASSSSTSSQMSSTVPYHPSYSIKKFVYFLQANDYLLAYDIIEQRWHQRLLIRRYAQMLLPIKANDMAFGKHNELLISDIDGSIFSTTNTLLDPQMEMEIENEEEEQKENNFIEKYEIYQSYSNRNRNRNRSDDVDDGYLALNHLGSLLGPSRNMMVDFKNTLYYIMPKYGAVVRCPQYSKNLTAEGNEIIYMTSKNITQIFFGTEGSVWLVTDRELQPNDHCFASQPLQRS